MKDFVYTSKVNLNLVKLIFLFYKFLNFIFTHLNYFLIYLLYTPFIDLFFF